MKKPTNLSYNCIRLLEEVTDDGPVNGEMLNYQPYPYGSKANMTLLEKRKLVFVHKTRNEGSYCWPTLKGLKLMVKISSWEFKLQSEMETKERKEQAALDKYDRENASWPDTNYRVDN